MKYAIPALLVAILWLAIRYSADPLMPTLYMDRAGGIYKTPHKNAEGDDLFRCVTEHKAYQGGVCIGSNSGTWYANVADIDATMKPVDPKLGHAASMPVRHGQE